MREAEFVGWGKSLFTPVAAKRGEEGPLHENPTAAHRWNGWGAVLYVFYVRHNPYNLYKLYRAGYSRLSHDGGMRREAR